MSTNQLHDQSFSETTVSDLGRRAEILPGLSLGVLATLLAAFLYKNPITITAALAASAVGFFAMYQAFQKRYGVLILFPIFAAVAICIAVIVEGQGAHDLLWLGSLGLFLLANLKGRERLSLLILLGTLMVGAFAGTGLAEVYGLRGNPHGTTEQFIVLGSFSLAAMMALITFAFRRRYSLLEEAVENRNVQMRSNMELQKIGKTLESQVEICTRQLDETSQQLWTNTSRQKAISEISQEIASRLEQNPQEFLDYIARAISEKLDFYHTGIFLLDENREYAVLRAANSAGGQRMLERRHQLKVGGTGIVGYVSQSGRPRIALDTGSDAVFFNNPDLPQTHSEMAIPLRYGSRMIGVLDIQSTQPSAFKEEDANLLSPLANQIAVSVHGVVVEGPPPVFSLQDRKTGRLGRQAVRRQKKIGYAFNPDGTISAATVATDNPLLKKALSSGEVTVQNEGGAALMVPVKFRDQVIGVIQIEATEGNRKWTEDEIMVVQSISERAAFALENARLFEETSRRAKQEQTIARVTSQIGASTDFNHILQTTIEELGRTLGTTRTFIQMEASTDEGLTGRQPVTDQ